MRRYLELGNVRELQRDLAQRGMVTKRQCTRYGSIRGGIPSARGPLYLLLKNRVYRGETVHKARYILASIRGSSMLSCSTLCRSNLQSSLLLGGTANIRRIPAC
jgi:hypothetical protein